MKRRKRPSWMLSRREMQLIFIAGGASAVGVFAGVLLGLYLVRTW